MSKERVERRLAAILAADVAGYSRLMGADEEGTLRRLRAHRREVVDPKIREHRGRIVKTTGDGMLVEFASVVDGVRCAVEVQRTMIERELDLADDQRISFRIGINLGDIIVEAEDIFGDGVTARLEGLAEPGGVCIAGGVMEQIDGKLPYAFHDIGMQVLKNIARPVHAHLLDAAAVATTALVPVKPRRPPAPRHPWYANPPYATLAAKVVEVGLLRAGLPEA
jgi:class 3 adenylate cyclase